MSKSTIDHATERNSVTNLSEKLKTSKNIILRGAPGTGKSYLAKEIAAHIISDGKTTHYEDLKVTERNRICFVQFHPSYDYTDFIEGLRPISNSNGTIGFKLMNGAFKNFIQDCLEISFTDNVISLLNNDISKTNYSLYSEKKSNKMETFSIKAIEKTRIICKNNKDKEIPISANHFIKLIHAYEAHNFFDTPKDISNFFGHKDQSFSYLWSIINQTDFNKDTLKYIKELKCKEKDFNFVFIIDEINRGEISNIFGELFFSIDPGYRGKSGAVQTQYNNLHLPGEEPLYIPENLYIIGTMNDIDRSVDTFDFAMRRRFRFIEITANDDISTRMLNNLSDSSRKDEALLRMNNLNNSILKVEGLDRNYQIGAAYFLKLETLDKDELWEDYLEPLLESYLEGIPDQEKKLCALKKAYDSEEEDDKTNVNNNS